MPQTQERKVTSPKITDEAREALVGEMVSLAEVVLTEDDVSRAENLQDVQKHVGLIAMLGALELGWARAPEKAHTRKILAHEYVQLPKGKSHSPGTSKLLAAVRDAAKPEIAAVRSFKGDADRMPPAYRLALDDRNSFEEQLTTDPMQLKLKRTVAELQSASRRVS